MTWVSIQLILELPLEYGEGMVERTISTKFQSSLFWNYR